MAITAAQRTRVRVLAGVTSTDYPDATVDLAITEYPIPDSAGLWTDDPDWTATYDLYRAAADIVDQRAANVILQYDVTADGAGLSRSQMQKQLMTLATRLRSRAMVAVTFRPNDATYNDDDETETEDD